MRSKKIEEAAWKLVNANYWMTWRDWHIACEARHSLIAALALPEDTEQSDLLADQCLGALADTGGEAEQEVAESGEPQDWMQAAIDELEETIRCDTSNSDHDRIYNLALRSAIECFENHRAKSNKGGDVECQGSSTVPGCNARAGESSPEKKYGRWSTYWLCDCPGSRPLNFAQSEDCGGCGCVRPLPKEQGESKPEKTSDALAILRRIWREGVDERLDSIEHRLSAIEATAVQVAEEQATDHLLRVGETAHRGMPEPHSIPNLSAVVDEVIGEPEGKEPVSTVPDPGEGYRLLGPDEPLCANDQCWKFGCWLDIHPGNVGSTRAEFLENLHTRRKIEPEATPAPEPFTREPGYLYIFTAEEKAKYGPKQKGDEVFLWRTGWKPTFAYGAAFSPFYTYRRRIEPTEVPQVWEVTIADVINGNNLIEGMPTAGMGSKFFVSTAKPIALEGHQKAGVMAPVKFEEGTDNA